MTATEDKAPGGFLKPFLAVSIMIPIQFITGAIFGQSAGMLPQLLAPNDLIRISMDEGTWIASIPVVGTMISSVLCGPLADRLGRIRMMQVSQFIIGAGFGLMAASINLSMLMSGRFLIGLGCGFSFPCLVYVGETSPSQYRSVFLSLGPLASSVGLVYMYILGGYLPWNIAAGFTSLICFLNFLSTFFFYESPQWLVSKNKLEDALKSIKRVEPSENADAKLRELQDIAAIQAKNSSSFSLKLIKEPTVWKPFLMIMIMAILQNGCGLYIVVYYTVNFMDEFHTTFDSLQVTVALGATRLLGCVLASCLLRRFGRKSIGVVSGFTSTIVLCIIYIFLALEYRYPKFVADYTWIPVGSFVLFIITTAIGIFCLPWTMPYEMFPIRVRGMMCGMTFAFMYLIMFIYIKSYRLLMDYLGLGGMMFFFAINCFLFGVFSATILIETHHKTLDQIEQKFSSGSYYASDEKTPI